MIRTVRDAQLSLWQSSVADALRGGAFEKAALSGHERDLPAVDGRPVMFVVAHPVMGAVNRHVVAHDRRRRSGAGDPPSVEALDGMDEAARLSGLHFELAEARARGDDAAVRRLMSEVRKYSTRDLAGWATCVETYFHYRTKYSEPLYRDWKKLGKDIATFGVVKYRIPADAKVAIIGDWGTGMDDAVALLAQIAEHRPDAVIHLGDVYYSGTPNECQLNVAVPFSKVFPRDRRPLFLSLPGNHDYYSFGEGFYQLIDGANSDPARTQEASYFCLRTEDGAWQFLGMDTGRHDFNPIPGFHVEAPDLEASEKQWHRDKLSGKRFGGSTILLSHHQLFSQHSKLGNGQRPWVNEHLLGIFEPYFDRVAAWLWGHEHNLALYQNGCMGLARGRLVGCSAYEESTGESPYKPYSDAFAVEVPYRTPLTEIGSAEGYYHHGYAVIDFASDPPTINYYQFPSWGTEADMSKAKIDKIASEQIEHPPKPEPKGAVVNFSDKVFLQHARGEYIVGFYPGQQYYPQLGNTGSVALELKGGTGSLKNGDTVQIVSTEDNLEGYNMLGAWSLSRDVYYYKKNYHEKKQSWKVMKKSDPDDLEVHYGDEVYLMNVSFNQRLVSDGKFLTTAKGTGESWFLRKHPVAQSSSAKTTTDGERPVEGTASGEMESPPRLRS